MAKERLYVHVEFHEIWMNGYMCGSGRTWADIKSALKDSFKVLKEIAPEFRVFTRVARYSPVYEEKAFYKLFIDGEYGSPLPREAHVGELRAMVTRIILTQLGLGG